MNATALVHGDSSFDNGRERPYQIAPSSCRRRLPAGCAWQESVLPRSPVLGKRPPQEWERVKEYDLYVPLFLNDGTPVSDEFIDQLGQKLLQRFGGCTFFPQPN